ncbi:hypothetical protein [Pseudomonas sp. PSKL.D1]|uniref:hypothetical protein n=1 Tax=Pseudomonas sp. PSKL.D1 TaxID=3029060 RepID=UPI00238167C0|nr:hypothetical protein [Pseudomonas sp. PSKL.D1]WDY56344.1 hypothetical protein PVV54_17270 [Pseudomonas sp. PSKL.D1]
MTNTTCTLEDFSSISSQTEIEEGLELKLPGLTVLAWRKPCYIDNSPEWDGLSGYHLGIEFFGTVDLDLKQAAYEISFAFVCGSSAPSKLKVEFYSDLGGTTLISTQETMPSAQNLGLFSSGVLNTPFLKVRVITPESEALKTNAWLDDIVVRSKPALKSK